MDTSLLVEILKRCVLFSCAEHGTNLTGESSVMGIYRQV